MVVAKASKHDDGGLQDFVLGLTVQRNWVVYGLVSGYQFALETVVIIIWLVLVKFTL